MSELEPGDESDRDLARRIVVSLVESAVREGELDFAGRSDRDLELLVRDFVREVLDSGADFEAELSHESRLVAEADRLHADGESDLALVLYATRIEHWLNGMLASALTRRGFTRSDRREVLQASLRAKVSWIWRLLYGNAMPDDVSSRISAVAERRNAFVHYKWSAVPEHEDSIPRDIVELCEAAPELMTRLDALEDELLFDGGRKQLRAAISHQQSEDGRDDE